MFSLGMLVSLFWFAFWAFCCCLNFILLGGFQGQRVAMKGHREMDRVGMSNVKSTKNKFKKSFFLKKYIRLHYTFLLKIRTRKGGSVAYFLLSCRTNLDLREVRGLAELHCIIWLNKISMLPKISSSFL